MFRIKHASYFEQLEMFISVSTPPATASSSIDFDNTFSLAAEVLSSNCDCTALVLRAVCLS